MNSDLKGTLLLVATVTALSLGALVGLARASEDCESPTHCVLVSLTPWHEDSDELTEERSARLLEHARGIDAATDDQTERALLMMTANEESHFARFVDLDWDKCRLGLHKWCDAGKAFGVIQLHDVDRGISRAEMYRIGIGAMRRAGNACRDRGGYWVGAISLYATGRTCSWASAKGRSERMWELAQRLGKAGGGQ